MEQLERNLLYYYVLELEAYRTELKGDNHHSVKLRHFSLLVEYMRTACISTTSRLASLLKNREITYDLLWALFKPSTTVYMTIVDAEKRACYRYDSSEERTAADLHTSMWNAAI